jgi:hypothetical protein
MITGTKVGVKGEKWSLWTKKNEVIFIHIAGKSPVVEILEKLCECISILAPCHHPGLLRTFLPLFPCSLQAKTVVYNMKLKMCFSLF